MKDTQCVIAILARKFSLHSFFFRMSYTHSFLNHINLTLETLNLVFYNYNVLTIYAKKK